MPGTAGMAQLVKCLPCKREDPSSIPSTHIKKQKTKTVGCGGTHLSSQGSVGTGGSLKSLAGQPTLISKTLGPISGLLLGCMSKGRGRAVRGEV